jgi:parallel beta-helix repeat protein
MKVTKRWQSSFFWLILILTLVHVADFVVIEGASQTIHVPDDFSSIQAAINNATPGDTIFVHQGIYYENIMVNKSISLIGEHKNSTIIDGKDLGSVIVVTENMVKISGFTLRNTGAEWPNSGIQVLNSYVCTFSDNIITGNHIGIMFESSGGNIFSGNDVTNNHYGMYILESWQNKISDNDFLHNWAGVIFAASYENIFEGNVVEGCDNVGIYISSSYDNSIYWNNFVNNQYQASVYPTGYFNTWDAGYPQGGNFWSDYGAPDIYSGPYQNETGSDGIGDFPYRIGHDNEDRYPHIREVVVFHDVTVKSVILSASKIYEGQILEIYVTVANTGNYTESFSVTAYYDTTIIEAEIVSDLESGSELSLTFAWHTTGVEADRIYAVSAEASEVLGERDKSNNLVIGGIVRVRSYATLLVGLDGVTPCNQSGYPDLSFRAGAIGYFRVVVNNNAPESETALITVNAFDASSATLGVVSFKSTIMPGISTFILGLPIPSGSSTGTASVYANAFTDWPYLGGVPCCPEASATFQITG